jgi:hypothetical protein
MRQNEQRRLENADVVNTLGASSASWARNEKEEGRAGFRTMFIWSLYSLLRSAGFWVLQQ